MKNNNVKYFIQNTLYSTANMMITGSVIQGFLLESGVSENIVTAYLSVVQIIQVSVMLIFSMLIDRIRNILRAYAWSSAIQISVFSSLIFLCLFQNVPITTKYLLVFATGIITNVAQAAYNILLYKAPFHILDMSNYAQMTGAIGVVVGTGCIVVSAAMSFFTGRFEYYATMLGFFLFGTAALLTSFFLTLSYVPVEPKDYSPVKKKEKKNLFRYRPFFLLVLPNLLRGFAAGILIVAMTIGFSEGITTQSSAAVLTLLLQIGNVLSSFLYTVLVKRVKNSVMILASSAALLLFMPTMLTFGTLSLFYVMYFFANFFVNIINNAVPVAVVGFVDYDYMGQYSSWRMLLHTAGVAIASAVLPSMLGLFGGVWTLLIGAVCQILSGAAYFAFLRKVGEK